MKRLCIFAVEIKEQTMSEIKIIDKEVYKKLDKNNLIRKGDYTDLATITGKTRQHIKTAICNEGSTTEEVVAAIMDFYKKRIEEKKETIETINELI